MVFLFVILLCTFAGSAVSISDPHHTQESFEGSEHRAASNYGLISLLETAIPEIKYYNESVANVIFYNSKAKNLSTYGDIVATAGDFFGPINELTVICSGSTITESSFLFRQAFFTLWNTEDSAFLARIKAAADEELAVVDANKMIFPYKSFATLEEKRWRAVFDNDILMGLLLTNNFDHFSSCANYAYKVGHTVAMETAKKAGAALVNGFDELSSDQKLAKLVTTKNQLKMAYAMNAFADHYLTDLFSAGHIRTPRRKITIKCLGDLQIASSFVGPLSSGGLASQWMHDEDNRNGLLVTNKRGDIWTAYGDDNYFDARNARSREIIYEAVQISRNEVFAAFLGEPETHDALLLIPDESQMDRFSVNNTCPLFYADTSEEGFGTVYIRNSEELRPGAWLMQAGFPGSADQITCGYQVFTADKCPHAILAKLEGFAPTWIEKAYSQQLQWIDEFKAWKTKRPDPSVVSSLFSNAGFVAIAIVGGIIVAYFTAVLEVVFNSVKNRASGNNKGDTTDTKICAECQRISKESTMEWMCDTGFCHAEFRTGCSPLPWAWGPSLVAAFLTIILFCGMYGAIVELMPDMEVIFTPNVWGILLGLGSVVAIIARAIIKPIIVFFLSWIGLLWRRRFHCFVPPISSTKA